MGRGAVIRITDHLFRFDNGDGCATYLIRDRARAIVIDPGRCEWIDQLPRLGIETLEAIYLTHHHHEQLQGLYDLKRLPCTVHAPADDRRFIEPGPERFGDSRDLLLGDGCPASYAPPRRGIRSVAFDVVPNSDHYRLGRRIRFLHTPGHGSAAVSILFDIDGMQVVFSGDAVHHGGTVWEPFHLETDHWTGAGALAAWEGIERLRGVRIDLLCPSHGPVVRRAIGPTLRRLSRRLLRFYHAKGQISPRVADRYVPTEALGCGAVRISPHLFQFGSNGYLVVADSGRALVVDPCGADMAALSALRAELGNPEVARCTATHYHLDHCDAADRLREDFGAEVVLHERVSWPLWPPERHRILRAPWLPPSPVRADIELRGDGTFTWEGIDFEYFAAPGQTWWHAALIARIDGRRVLFSGDTIQPSSRWNGTGGFCAYNRSRLREGFVPTCKRLLRCKPDVVAAGHGTVFFFDRRKFVLIARWARTAERAVKALCPSRRPGEYYRWPATP